MLGKKYAGLYLSIVLVLLTTIGLLAACDADEEPEIIAHEGVQTQLLVKAPVEPLPLNEALDVKSRTVDVENGVSHVELYAVQSPAGEEALLLIRSDPAPFAQTSFTVSQVFVPVQPGHYVIKVVGYNNLGQSAESDYIGFDVE